MDSFKDHLLILDEISTDLIGHAADKAAHVASKAKSDAGLFKKASSVAANQFHNFNTAAIYGRQADKAEKYAERKHDQSRRLYGAKNYRNFVKDQDNNVVVPTKRY